MNHDKLFFADTLTHTHTNFKRTARKFKTDGGQTAQKQKKKKKTRANNNNIY